MDPCKACRAGKCRGQRHSLIVSDFELSNPHFIRDVRDFGYRLAKRPAEWIDFALDLLARFEGCILDSARRPIQLATDIFLPSDEEIDQDRADAIEARMRNWFDETFCAPTPNQVSPRLRIEARERFRIVATILRAAYPLEAMMWGVRPANDNEPLIPPSQL